MAAHMEAAPAWYWSRGLHDAAITGVDELELPVDWKAGIRRWNCLELALDCRGALFETNVPFIRFYNYKIISGDLNRLREPHTWWFSDELESDGKGYRLTILFESANSDRFRLEIGFADAIVERKLKNRNGEQLC